MTLIRVSDLLKPVLRNTDGQRTSDLVEDAVYTQDSREAVCRGARSDATPSVSVMQAKGSGQRLSGWTPNSFLDEETA